MSRNEKLSEQFQALAKNVEALERDVLKIRTAGDRDRLVESLQAAVEQSAPHTALTEWTQRAKMALGRARRASVLSEELTVDRGAVADLANRDRLLTDRRAYTLAETALETAAALAAPAASTDAIIEAPGLGAAHLRGKERAAARQSAATRFQETFAHAVGELTYRALPLDEHEKAPYRSTILEQVGEAVLRVGRVPTDGLGATVADLVSSLVEQASEDCRQALTESEEFAALAAPAAAEIEQRVLAALLASQRKAAVTESALTSIERSSDDGELSQLRIRRLNRRSQPSLLESLFIANRQGLSETAGGDVPAGIVLAEAVCQYTMLEALSALGLVDLTKSDVVELAKRLGEVR